MTTRWLQSLDWSLLWFQNNYFKSKESYLTYIILFHILLLKMLNSLKEEKMAKSNNQHSELQEGEIFYRNVFSEKQFKKLLFCTKRMGRAAYYGNGEEIGKLTRGGGPFPVFVQRLEYERFKQEGLLWDLYLFISCQWIYIKYHWLFFRKINFYICL